jgi:hypothetical protein
MAHKDNDISNKLQEMFEVSGSGVFDLISAMLINAAETKTKNEKEYRALIESAHKAKDIADFILNRNGMFLAEVFQRK